MANVDVNKPNIVFFKPTQSAYANIKNEFTLFGSQVMSSGSLWVRAFQILVSFAELKNSKNPGIAT